MNLSPTPVADGLKNHAGRPVPVVVTAHSLARGSQRTITTYAMEQALLTGVVVEDDRRPVKGPLPAFAAQLRSGRYGHKLVRAEVYGRTLHLVVATSHDAVRVITTYVPDASQWDATGTVRRVAVQVAA